MQPITTDSIFEHRASAGYPISPREEEFPVTLQQGFVGDDGLLIASDQKATFLQGAIHTGALTHKIEWNAGNGIVCAASGNDTVAPRIAREMVTCGVSDTADGGEVYRLLQTRVDGLWMEHVPKKRDGEPDRNPDSCLIVGLIRNQNHLWRISARQWTNSGVSPYTNKTPPTGDTGNAAQYFSERFYKQMSVDRLALLAAHVILEGGKLSSWVEGLDILSWKFCDREPHLYSHTEKELLLQKSQALSCHIEACLLGDHVPLAF
jgi:hypothetical protein